MAQEFANISYCFKEEINTTSEDKKNEILSLTEELGWKHNCCDPTNSDIKYYTFFKNKKKLPIVLEDYESNKTKTGYLSSQSFRDVQERLTKSSYSTYVNLWKDDASFGKSQYRKYKDAYTMKSTDIIKLLNDIDNLIFN